MGTVDGRDLGNHTPNRKINRLASSSVVIDGLSPTIIDESTIVLGNLSPNMTPRVQSNITSLIESNIPLTPVTQPSFTQKTQPGIIPMTPPITIPLTHSMPVISDSVPSLTEDSPGFDPDFLSLLEETQISVQKKQDRPLVILSETQCVFEGDQEEDNRKEKKIKLQNCKDLTQNHSNHVKCDGETEKMGNPISLRNEVEVREFELNEIADNGYLETDPHEDSSGEMIETVTVNNNECLTIVDNVVTTDTNRENNKYIDINSADHTSGSSEEVGSNRPLALPRYLKLTSPRKLLKNRTFPGMRSTAPQFNMSYTVYNCDVCGEHFFSRNDVETHVQVKHGWKL